MPKAESTVQYEQDGPIVTITLRRSEAGNAINEDMASDFRAACHRLLDDPNSCRVVILAAEGNDFCLGTDETFFQEALRLESLTQVKRLIGRFSVAHALAAVPVPVLASLKGEVRGQGLELALAADLRVATPGTFFRMDQLARGTLPLDGGSQRLPRLVGRGLANWMLVTGEGLSASEAERLGFVNRIVPAEQLMDQAEGIAAVISQGGPIASRYAKEAVNQGMEMALDQGARLEVDLTMILQTTKDRMEGIRSFLERRKPVFRGE